MLVAKQTTIKQETSLHMHPNQRATKLQQQLFTNHAKKCDPHIFINILNTNEYFTLLNSLIPAHRSRLFPPKLTLSMFMAQTLNEDRSCQNIVDETAIKQVLAGEPICSTNTGAYCKARQRMPLELPSTLARYTGELLSANSPHQWRSPCVRIVVASNFRGNRNEAKLY